MESGLEKGEAETRETLLGGCYAINVRDDKGLK